MKIRELLDSPEKWIQGKLAADSNGNTVTSLSVDSCRWCIVGSIIKCYGCNEFGDDRYAVANRISDHLSLYPLDISKWNDAPERTFEDIRKLVEELDI